MPLTVAAPEAEPLLADALVEDELELEEPELPEAEPLDPEVVVFAVAELEVFFVAAATGADAVWAAAEEVCPPPGVDVPVRAPPVPVAFAPPTRPVIASTWQRTTASEALSMVPNSTTYWEMSPRSTAISS
ncbi:hypothetical protein [Paludisphaera mucosa]|uniref:Uncharacterized protein n=1 Tax=Paludisphaera mucosa TaxID=3030827 RepID=A0ABT6F7C7_9BACT|nr:hypothetical protein [Paludisphaera mucosa]MDG3003483.1 hypothetical protein [Paludisphaera mucosa]